MILPFPALSLRAGTASLQAYFPQLQRQQFGLLGHQKGHLFVTTRVDAFSGS